MRALGGSWAALAAEFGGSHLVMKCFDFAVRSAMRFSLAVRSQTADILCLQRR